MLGNGRRPMRWEVVAAGLTLAGYWANSLWMLQKIRDGGTYWWWHDLLYTLPWFILCPAFAVSGLRHPRTSSGWRRASGLILVAWLLSPQTWYTFGYLLTVARMAVAAE
jgi:hypothetical protein